MKGSEEIGAGLEGMAASLSESMLRLSASPMESLRTFSASPTADAAKLASLSRDLDSLSSAASLAASMASFMASFARALKRVETAT